MPLVWFVPGFGGTELALVKRTDSGGVASRRNLWGGFQQLANVDAWEQLALPQPDPSLGNVEPVRLATEVESYGAFWRALPGLFDPTLKVQVRAWPYDFRLSPRVLGESLANAIVARGAVEGGHWLLAHSYGALVAHAAWAFLVGRLAQALVTRITTFGGILYGSHNAASAWTEREDGIGMLALAGSLTRLLVNPTGVFQILGSGSVNGLKELLLRVFLSWPANYCMLPDPGMSDDPADTHRLELEYSAAPWARALVTPSQALMDSARTDFWAWIRQAMFQPPPNISNHIVATGQVTDARVVPVPTNRAIPPSVYTAAATPGGTRARQSLLPRWTTRDGDGRATPEQQSFPGHSREYVVGVHGALHDNPGVRALIPILLTRSEAAPQPAPIQSALPPDQQFLVDGSWLQTVPAARPVGGSVGAPARLVKLDP